MPTGFSLVLDKEVARQDFWNGMPTLKIAKKHGCRGQTIVDLVNDEKWERVIDPLEKRVYNDNMSTIIRHCTTYYSSKAEYVYLARRLEKPIYNLYRHLIDPKNLKSKTKYSLDHRYSLHAGWINKLPLHFVSHPVNLRIILLDQNILKGAKSSISVDTLKKNVLDFDNQHDSILGELYAKSKHGYYISAKEA